MHPHVFVMSKTTTSQSSESARPEQIRRLVLDYLCNHCYADTARAFARDSTPREVDRNGDEVLLEEGSGYGLDSASLRFVRVRKEIQARILAGNIPECIESLNKHFPDVLSPASTDSPYNPYHLRLNLKIQYFIELARTLPLPWPHDLGIGDPKLTLNNNYEEEMTRKRRLITLMNELWTLVYSLPDAGEDRNLYIRELNDVGGLLAYPVPEKSRELRKYLDKTRREAVADQINEAILCRMDKMVPSVIELCARQTTSIFAMLHYLNRALPAVEQRPAALKSLFSLLLSSSKSTTSVQDIKFQKADKDKEKDEIVPIFQLNTLLGTET